MLNRLKIRYIFNIFSTNVEVQTFKTKLNTLNLLLQLSTNDNDISVYTSGRTENIIMAFEGTFEEIKKSIELYKKVDFKSNVGILLYILIQDIPFTLNTLDYLINKQLDSLGCGIIVLNYIYIYLYKMVCILVKWLFILKSVLVYINKYHLKSNQL